MYVCLSVPIKISLFCQYHTYNLHTYVYTCIHTHLYTQFYTHVFSHVHSHFYIHDNIHVSTHVYIICTHILNTFLYTYIYKHVNFSSDPNGFVSIFKTLHLVADQSLAANSTYASKIYKEKSSADFFVGQPKMNSCT